jgi:hypothetical protein
MSNKYAHALNVLRGHRLLRTHKPHQARLHPQAIYSTSPNSTAAESVTGVNLAAHAVSNLMVSIILRRTGRCFGNATLLFTHTGGAWQKIYQIIAMPTGLTINGIKLAHSEEQVSRSRLWQAILKAEQRQQLHGSAISGYQLMSRIENAIAHVHKAHKVHILTVANPGKGRASVIAQQLEDAVILRRPDMTAKYGLKVVKVVDRNAWDVAKALGQTADKVEGLNITQLKLTEELIAVLRVVLPSHALVGADFDSGYLYLLPGQPSCSPEQAQKFYRRILKRPGVSFQKPVKVVFLSMGATELNGPLGLVLDQQALCEASSFWTLNFQATIEFGGVAGKGCFFGSHSPSQAALTRRALKLVRQHSKAQGIAHEPAALLVNLDELARYVGSGDLPAEGSVGYLESGDITFMDSFDGDAVSQAKLTLGVVLKHYTDGELTSSSLRQWVDRVKAGFNAFESGDISGLIKADALPRFGIYSAIAALGLEGFPESMVGRVSEQFHAWLARMLGEVKLPAYRRYLGANRALAEDEVTVPVSLKDAYPIGSICLGLSHPTQSDLTYGKFRVASYTRSEVFALNDKVVVRLRRDNDGDSLSLFVPGSLPLNKAYVPQHEVNIVKQQKTKRSSKWSSYAIAQIATAEQAPIGVATHLIMATLVECLVRGDEALRVYEENKIYFADCQQGILDSKKHTVASEYLMSGLQARMSELLELHEVGCASKDDYGQEFLDMVTRSAKGRTWDSVEETLTRSMPVVSKLDNYTRRRLAVLHSPRQLDERELRVNLAVAVLKIQAQVAPAVLESEMEHISFWANRLWSYYAEQVKQLQQARKANPNSKPDWDQLSEDLALLVAEATEKMITPEARRLLLARACLAKREGLSYQFLAILTQSLGEEAFVRQAIQDTYQAGPAVRALTCEAIPVCRAEVFALGLKALRARGINPVGHLECVIKQQPENLTTALSKGKSGLVLDHQGEVVAFVYAEYGKFLKPGMHVTFDRFACNFTVNR